MKHLFRKNDAAKKNRSRTFIQEIEDNYNVLLANGSIAAISMLMENINR